MSGYEPDARAELILNLLEGSASIGATPQEIRDATGAPTLEVLDVIVDLRQEGRIVRLTERRNGWRVYVLPGDVQGREIDSSERRAEVPDGRA